MPPEKVLHSAILSGQSTPLSKLGYYVRRMLLIWQYRWCQEYIKKHEFECLVIWNGVKGHRALLAFAAKSLGLKIVFFEEAPLPDRITVDSRGVNFNLSLPRNPAFFTELQESSDWDPVNWRTLQAKLTARPVTNNLATSQATADDSFTRDNYLFCPLQVPGDSQVTVFGDWISSIAHLIEVLVQAGSALPEGWHIRVKEHPSSKTSLTDFINSRLSDRFRLDNQTNTFDQVARSRGVITINSSVGLESFFFDQPVLVLGKAFYGFGDVALKVTDQEHLMALMSSPEKLSFSAQQRNNLMTYLKEVQFPSEEDLCNGKYVLADLEARETMLNGWLGKA